MIRGKDPAMFINKLHYSKNRLLLCTLFVSLAAMLSVSAIRPVVAYSGGKGNSNYYWTTTSSTECQGGNYAKAVLSMAWDTQTPVISSNDPNNNKGEWSWQVQIQTSQRIQGTGNSYQYVQLVSNYALTEPSVWALLINPPYYAQQGGRSVLDTVVELLRWG
jgi:hypothetical protein